MAGCSSGSGGPVLEFAEFRPGDDARSRRVGLEGAVRDRRARGRPCSCVLPRPEYRLQQVETPDLPAEELRDAVRWQLKDLIDFPVTEAVVDAVPVPARSMRGDTRMTYAVAAHRPVVNAATELVRGAGLQVQAIDIVELALRNMAACHPEQRGGVAILALSREGGVMTISREGTLYLARSLDLGAAHVAAGGEPALERLALELQRSLDYYESQLYGAPAGRVLLLALTELDAESLAERLNEQLGVTVEALDFDQLLARTAGLVPAQQQRCALAIGAALRGLERHP